MKIRGFSSLSRGAERKICRSELDFTRIQLWLRVECSGKGIYYTLRVNSKVAVE